MQTSTKLFSLLKQFTTMEKLIKKKYIKSEFTGKEYKLLDNLFGTYTIFVDEMEYVFFEKERTENFFYEVFLPLFELFKEEEKYFIFQRSMDVSNIWENTFFQTFLAQEKYENEQSEQYLYLQFYIKDEEDEECTIAEDVLDWVKENPDGEYSFVLTVSVDEYEDEEEIDDWFMDKSVRLRFITEGKNPNEYLSKCIVKAFQKEEVVAFLDQHSLVSEFYSDYSDDTFAFNIKVYESFIHEELLEFGLVNEEQEWDHRTQAVEQLVEEIEDAISPFSLESTKQAGKSSGYLVLTFDDLDLETAKKVCEIIEEGKESYYQHYQSLECYEYGFDDFIPELEELQEEAREEEDKEKVTRINALLDAMKQMAN